MLTRLDRYILKQCIEVVIFLTFLALGIFLLERLLAIFEKVADSSDTMSIVSRMIVNLVPYNLGLAIPIALMLGTLITIDRLNRTGEFSASIAAGVSLTQILKPFLILAAILAVIVGLLNSFLQPLGTYDYRATLAKVSQTNFEAVLQEGKFAQFENLTFWTDNRTGGDRLGLTQIVEKDDDGVSMRIAIAPSGIISKGIEDNETRITLNDVQVVVISEDEVITEQIDSQQSDWIVAGEITQFRARGEDRLELTLPELIMAANGAIIGGYDGEGVPKHIAAADANDRIARMVMLFVLPFIALPLGLGYGRSFQSTGIVVAFLIMLIAHKSMETGYSLAEAEKIAPWMGSWPVIGVLALIGGGLFIRSAYTVATPPLMLVSSVFSDLFKRAFSAVGPLFQRQSKDQAASREGS
ncbi:MAG: LptF/LptG family permease [Pseudomonadota bacterium]